MPHILIGFFLVLLNLFLGNLISHFIFHGLFPGSVTGMILLFIGLKTKMINPDYVKDFCRLVARYIPLFFVPIGVGLMDSYDVIKSNFLIILFSSLISTVVVLLFIPKFYIWVARKY